jgi:hypothetical protein
MFERLAHAARVIGERAFTLHFERKEEILEQSAPGVTRKQLAFRKE